MPDRPVCLGPFSCRGDVFLRVDDSALSCIAGATDRERIMRASYQDSQIKYMNSQNTARKSRGLAQANTLRKSNLGDDVE